MKLLISFETQLKLYVHHADKLNNKTKFAMYYVLVKLVLIDNKYANNVSKKAYRILVYILHLQRGFYRKIVRIIVHLYATAFRYMSVYSVEPMQPVLAYSIHVGSYAI